MQREAAVEVRFPAAEKSVGRAAGAKRRFQSIVLADVIEITLIVLIGAATFVSVRHARDFVQEDVFYADAGRALVQHGFYGINGHPETNQPPGLPAILGLLFAVFGYGYMICLKASVVFQTLGMLLAYAVLRRRVHRLIAGAICLVLISSPVFFQISTQEVWPSSPVLFSSMLALLAFDKYEEADSKRWRLAWSFVLAISTVASILIVSGTIALLGSMMAVLVLGWWQNRTRALARFKVLLPVILLGFVAQGFWMHRKPAPLEWPSLPGYPRPYLQQLLVKSGNYPELGMATPGDIPRRIWKHLDNQADLLVGLVARHGIKESKTFVIIIPILLVGIGWARGLLRDREALIAWYFAGYEFIYLLWPWEMEHRFFLPVAPLACMYLWQGLGCVPWLAATRRRWLGAVFAMGSLLLGISGWHWMWVHPSEGMGLYPDEVAAALWTILSPCFAWMACTGKPLSSLFDGSRPAEWWNRYVGRLRVPLTPAVVLATACLILLGIPTGVEIARQNIGYENLVRAGNTSVIPMWPEVEAGQWLRSHAPADSVIMARHLPIVYHYAERSSVWFPPISDPATLMSGIVRHHVDYVVVIQHSDSYYLPDDGYCFDRLLATQHGAFRLVFRDGKLRIFEVERQAAPAADI